MHRGRDIENLQRVCSVYWHLASDIFFSETTGWFIQRKHFRFFIGGTNTWVGFLSFSLSSHHFSCVFFYLQYKLRVPSTHHLSLKPREWNKSPWYQKKRSIICYQIFLEYQIEKNYSIIHSCEQNWRGIFFSHTASLIMKTSLVVWELHQILEVNCYWSWS